MGNYSPEQWAILGGVVVTLIGAVATAAAQIIRAVKGTEERTNAQLAEHNKGSVVRHQEVVSRLMHQAKKAKQYDTEQCGQSVDAGEGGGR